MAAASPFSAEESGPVVGASQSPPKRSLPDRSPRTCCGATRLRLGPARLWVAADVRGAHQKAAGEFRLEAAAAEFAGSAACAHRVWPCAAAPTVAGGRGRCFAAAAEAHGAP